MYGICPKCNATVVWVNGSQIEIRSGNRIFKGISHHCASCNAVLSVQIDPFSLKVDTVNEVVSNLRRD